jgi:hypothetical protein
MFHTEKMGFSPCSQVSHQTGPRSTQDGIQLICHEAQKKGLMVISWY